MIVPITAIKTSYSVEVPAGEYLLHVEHNKTKAPDLSLNFNNEVGDDIPLLYVDYLINLSGERIIFYSNSNLPVSVTLYRINNAKHEDNSILDMYRLYVLPEEA